jgi:hypothetical protein
MTRIHRPANARWWWKWAVAGSAMAAVVLIVIVMWARRPAPAENVTALSSWRSPTQSLLSPPVAAVWITTPRLGEGYFKMKARGEIHDQ